MQWARALYDSEKSMTARNRILAIDDNPTNLLVMEEALGETYDIETAANGMEGLLLAQANSPDVVLLDVMMPGLDGYEACGRAGSSWCRPAPAWKTG
jgi:CheY-like chemotaxis protein